jgi:hypothetical protein
VSEEGADKLAALEEARARLETALSSDENWRALMQREVNDADWSAERQARDTRLAMALEANPLYRAWQHMNEAIDALSEAPSPALVERIERAARGEESAPAPPPSAVVEVERAPVAPAPAPPPKPPRSDVAAELPDDILALLHRDADAADKHVEAAPHIEGAGAGAPDQDDDYTDLLVAETSAPAVPAAPKPPAQAEPVLTTLTELTERIDRLDEELRELNARDDGLADAGDTAEVEIIEIDPRSAEVSPSKSPAGATPAGEPIEAAGKANVGASAVAAAVPTPVAVAPKPDSPGPQPTPAVPPSASLGGASSPAPAEQKPRVTPRPRKETEATVTFVTREPRAPLLPAAQLNSDLGTDRKTVLFERLREVRGDAEMEAAEPGAVRESFSPSSEEAEEAEVTIVTPDGVIKPDRPTSKRPGSVNRFLKALSGE